MGLAGQTNIGLTHSSKDTDDKHVDKEGDGESNGGLDRVVLDALLHLNGIFPRDSSALHDENNYYLLAVV